MLFWLGVSLTINIFLVIVIASLFYLYKHYIDVEKNCSDIVEKKGSDIVDKEAYNDFFNSNNNDRIFKLK